MTFKGRRAKACLCSSLTLLCLSFLLAFPLAAGAKKAPRETGARSASTKSKTGTSLVSSRSSSSIAPSRTTALARFGGNVDPVQATFEALRSGSRISVAQANQLLSSGLVTGGDLKAMLDLRVLDAATIHRGVATGRVSEEAAIEALGKGFVSDARPTRLTVKRGGTTASPLVNPKVLAPKGETVKGQLAGTSSKPGTIDRTMLDAQRLYNLLQTSRFSGMTPTDLLQRETFTEATLNSILMPGADRSQTFGQLLRTRQVRPPAAVQSVPTMTTEPVITDPLAFYSQLWDGQYANMTPSQIVQRGLATADAVDILLVPGANPNQPFGRLLRDRMIRPVGSQALGGAVRVPRVDQPGVLGGGCPANSNNCCVPSPNGSPGCNDPACCAAVCAADSFCCDVAWDGFCSGAAAGSCAVCLGGGGCPASTNNCCVPSPNGTPGCSDTTCCDAVCAADSFCCDVAWDGFCSGAAQSLCASCAGTDPCSTSTNDCCVPSPNGSPGCNDPACCDTVCAADPFCCDTAWDGFCSGAAQNLCASCAGVTPCTTSTNNCCVPSPNGSPGCNDPACCDTVCAADPFCCDVAWDGFCSGAAQNLCAQCAGVTPCTTSTNDCCVPSPNGTPGCNDPACCDAVCAADPFCCDVAWDGFCSGAAIVTCGCVPPPNPACDTSTNNCCSPSPNGSPGCNDPTCCNLICALDSFCCDVAWDSICSTNAAILCAACQLSCPCPPTGTTPEGEPNCGLPTDTTNGGCNTATAPGNCGIPHGGIGCSDQACEDIVCAADPFCCDVAWDGFCSAAANANCAQVGVPMFTTIVCGANICGSYHVSAANGTFDSDWYELTLGAGEVVEATFCVTSEGVATVSGFVEGSGSGSCGDITGFVNPGLAAGPCQQACNTVELEGPGQFWFIVLPQFFLDGQDCPVPYTATLACVPIGACCQQSTLTCDLMGQAECVASGGEYLGDGSSCGDCFGACCQPNNDCAITTESFCTGEWLGAGTGCEVANTYSANPNQPIPDSPGGPISSTINVPDSFDVSDLNVVLDINHTWVGDLTVCLTHGPFTVRLVDRPGLAGVTTCPGNNVGCCGCDADNYDEIVLDDEGTGGNIEAQCVSNLTSPPNYVPAQALVAFDGLDAQGAWVLTVQDNAGLDVGVLNSWSLQIGTGQNACNDPPTCSAGGPYTSACSPIAMTVSADDEDGDPVTYSWSSSNPAVIVTPAAGVTPPGGGPIAATASLAPGAAPCDVTATLTLNLSDGGGGVGACTTTVSFDDNVAPSISCPANTTIECDESDQPANTGTATATDNCDTTVTIGFTDTVVAGACADERTITRTWTATDDCGNSSSCTQTIVVEDTTPPTIVCPAVSTVQCGTLTDPSVTGAAVATDNCDPEPDLSYTQTDVDGTCPVIRVITRTWTATDRCGNEASCVQVINVVDTTPPVITQQPSFSGGVSNCAFLWPPNHDYVVFDISDTGIAATDNCGCAFFKFASCCSSQPEDANGVGDGNTNDDCIISVDGSKVAMRSERNGACGDLDRQYTVFIGVTDECGNSVTSDAAQVCVYHDQGHKPPPTGPVFEPGNYSGPLPPGQWVDSGCYGTDGSACGNGCTPNCDPTQF